ncbi:MAG: carbohydrate ABC transporter permease [Promethearchaeota archaeon]
MIFILPAYLALILFVFIPIGFAFIVSLFKNPTVLDLRNAFDYYLDFTIKNIFGMILAYISLVLTLLVLILFYKVLIERFDLASKIRILILISFVSIGLVIIFIYDIIFRIIPGINASNLSNVSIYNFFLRDDPFGKGVFMIGGLTILFTTILMIWYSRLAYRRLIFIQRKIVRASIAFILGLIIAPLTLLIFELIIRTVVGLVKLPIEEYRAVLTASRIDFMRILFNTFFWTLFCTVLHIILGMALAILLNREFAGRGVFRSLFILPWAIPSFVSTLMWRAYVFDKDSGVLGSLTGQFGSSASFTVGNLFALILAVISGILISVYSYKFLKKKVKITPAFRPLSYLVFGIIGIILIFLFNDLFQLLFNQFQEILGYKIVDIPEIKSTFWYTDDIYIFGVKFKMITFSAILINVWLGVPFMMLSFLATLQTIPQELYEAAEIDGLSSWGQFKKVTLPLLKPTLLTVSLLGIIWTFNLFNVVYLLSQNQTGIGDAIWYDIFVTFIYNLFYDQADYSGAAALSFTVFIILISFSLVYRKLIKVEEMWESER